MQRTHFSATTVAATAPAVRHRQRPVPVLSTARKRGSPHRPCLPAAGYLRSRHRIVEYSSGHYVSGQDPAPYPSVRRTPATLWSIALRFASILKKCTKCRSDLKHLLGADQAYPIE
ncbi:hypothetical protein EVAR_21923_1 [Eumeta japonica]|uniref:Uncharacterized protein n=1 Tax=Eumeta variegata TaxID=151549 RepID=A0A4C1XF43_EUMVA|nr:hypothetical protein EVAR_21923_1 [Eumeta japonica]